MQGLKKPNFSRFVSLWYGLLEELYIKQKQINPPDSKVENPLELPGGLQGVDEKGGRRDTVQPSATLTPGETSSSWWWSPWGVTVSSWRERARGAGEGLCPEEVPELWG